MSIVLVGALLLLFCAWFVTSWQIHRSFRTNNFNDLTSAAISWGWPAVAVVIFLWAMVALLFFVIELAAGWIARCSGNVRRRVLAAW